MRKRHIVTMAILVMMLACMSGCAGKPDKIQQSSQAENSSEQVTTASVMQEGENNSTEQQGTDEQNSVEDNKEAAESDSSVEEQDKGNEDIAEAQETAQGNSGAGHYDGQWEEAQEDNDSFAAGLSAAQSYSQLVVVESSGIRAKVTMHELVDGIWTEILSTDGFVGSMGVGQANEFQSITPEGTFPLYFAFGVKPNPGTALGYLQVDDNDYWVGDSSSPLYNQYVRTDAPFTEWDDAEHLIDYPNAYAYCLFIGYNVEGVAGAGSCFFLHCSTGGPTAGCVSVSEADMIFILNHIGGNCGIVIQ